MLQSSIRFDGFGGLCEFGRDPCPDIIHERISYFGNEFLFQFLQGRHLQAVNESKGRKHSQHEERWVDLVPEESIVSGRLVSVVIVVPSLSESDKRQKEVIFTGILCCITARTKHMGERIDGESSVP